MTSMVRAWALVMQLNETWSKAAPLLLPQWQPRRFHVRASSLPVGLLRLAQRRLNEGFYMGSRDPFKGRPRVCGFHIVIEGHVSG